MGDARIPEGAGGIRVGVRILDFEGIYQDSEFLPKLFSLSHVLSACGENGCNALMRLLSSDILSACNDVLSTPKDSTRGTES